MISREESLKVLKHVSRRCSALEDEEHLAYLSHQLALMDREEAKRLKLADNQQQQQQQLHPSGAQTARCCSTPPSKSTGDPASLPSLSMSSSSLTPSGAATSRSLPTILPTTLPGTKDPILEHGFSIGGEDDALALGTDASGGEALKFDGPSGVAALPDGELCVADTNNHRLVILTPEGQPRAFLHGGDGKEALKLPRGVAADATALYVTEVGGSRMRKLRLPEEFRAAGAETPRGAHLGGLALDATRVTAAGALTFPQGITEDRGELFVCDCENHCVAVYEALTLAYVRSFGTQGEAEGELSFPYSCTVVGREVIVADVANHRLSSFSRATGAFVRCIGSQGDGPGQFTAPRGVDP